MITGANHSRSKQLNKTLVLQTILREGPLSRLSIAKLADLTPATITNLTSELIQDGLVQEIGDIQSDRAGRRSVALNIAPDSRYALGVHVRQDRIEAGIVNLKGHVVREYRFEFQERVPDQHELLELLERSIHRMLAENVGRTIVGVGIGSVGLVDYGAGEIISAKNMNWGQLKVVEFLQQRIALPIVIDNNVSGMTLAEKTFGRAKHSNNFIFVYVGRGIGSGIMSNNQLHRRGRANSGEIGHATYHPGGEPCWCGNQGCLELYASGRTMIRSLQLDSVKQLADAARSGDRAAVETIRSAGEKIGTCMASFNNIFYVERAIIGGPLAGEDLPLVASIQEAFQRRSYLAAEMDPVEIVSSHLDEAVGIIGAASLAFHEYFLTI